MEGKCVEEATLSKRPPIGLLKLRIECDVIRVVATKFDSRMTPGDTFRPSVEKVIGDVVILSKQVRQLRRT